MKKALSVFLVIALVLAITISHAADYSSMTEEELKAEFNAIRNELTAKGLVAEKKTVLLEQDDIQIYINGEITIDKPYSWSTSSYLYLPIVVINNSTHNISVRLEDVSLNGWSVNSDTSDCSTPAGKKSKAMFSFSIEDAEIETLSDFTDAEFSIVVYDTETYRNLLKSKPVTVYAK